jgi:hypothetical protein
VAPRQGYHERLQTSIRPTFSPYLQIFDNSPVKNEVFSGPQGFNDGDIYWSLKIRKKPKTAQTILLHGEYAGLILVFT